MADKILSSSGLAHLVSKIKNAVKVTGTKKVIGENTSITVTGGSLTDATQAKKDADTFTKNEVAKLNEGFYTAGIEGNSATYTQGNKADWTASVSDGVLSFSFTPNGDDTFIPNTPTTPTTIDTSKFYGGSQASFTEGTFTPNNVGSVSKITASLGNDDVVTAITNIGDWLWQNT